MTKGELASRLAEWQSEWERLTRERATLEGMLMLDEWDVFCSVSGRVRSHSECMDHVRMSLAERRRELARLQAEERVLSYRIGLYRWFLEHDLEEFVS